MPRTKVKKLQLKSEELWKQICFKRDGRECQVRKFFPSLRITHSDVLQVDHAFSRRHKVLFTDISNGTVVCRNCNMNKRYNDTIRFSIYDIVKKREGEDIFERMREQVSAMAVFKNWGRIGWLETNVAILEDIKMGMERGNDRI